MVGDIAVAQGEIKPRWGALENGRLCCLQQDGILERELGCQEIS